MYIASFVPCVWVGLMEYGIKAVTIVVVLLSQSTRRQTVPRLKSLGKRSRSSDGELRRKYEALPPIGCPLEETYEEWKKKWVSHTKVHAHWNGIRIDTRTVPMISCSVEDRCQLMWGCLHPSNAGTWQLVASTGRAREPPKHRQVPIWVGVQSTACPFPKPHLQRVCPSKYSIIQPTPSNTSHSVH